MLVTLSFSRTRTVRASVRHTATGDNSDLFRRHTIRDFRGSARQLLLHQICSAARVRFRRKKRRVPILSQEEEVYCSKRNE